MQYFTVVKYSTWVKVVTDQKNTCKAVWYLSEAGGLKKELKGENIQDSRGVWDSETAAHKLTDSTARKSWQRVSECRDLSRIFVVLQFIYHLLGSIHCWQDWRTWLNLWMCICVPTERKSQHTNFLLMSEINLLGGLMFLFVILYIGPSVCPPGTQNLIDSIKFRSQCSHSWNGSIVNFCLKEVSLSYSKQCSRDIWRWQHFYSILNFYSL